MKARFITADVFTDRRFGGNQLAVFPDAEEIPPDLFQPIAREFNYSETTFVLPPENLAHDAKVRIFAPQSEMPFAGHPTIGTAHVLASIGHIPLNVTETKLIFEELAGLVELMILARGDKVEFVQLTSPQVPLIDNHVPPLDSIAEMISLSESDLLSNELRPVIASGGTPFLLVPVRLEAMARVRLRLDRYDALRKDHLSEKLFLYAVEEDAKSPRMRARMFAPAIGIPEDPATGSAAVALGGYLATQEMIKNGVVSWTIEQGLEIGRPSRLEVEAEKRVGEVKAVRVGGQTVIVTEGTMSL